MSYIHFNRILHKLNPLDHQGFPGTGDQGDEEVRDQGPPQDPQPFLQRDFPG